METAFTAADEIAVIHRKTSDPISTELALSEIPRFTNNVIIAYE